MTSTTGRNQTGFTLLELAVVVAIIFILASSLVVVIPMIELKAAKAKAEADIRRLDLALSIYKEAEGALPPDRFPLLNVGRTASVVTNINNFYGSAAAVPETHVQGNIYLTHYLTTRRSRDGYIELKANEVNRLSGCSLNVSIGNSLLLPGNATPNVQAFTLVDPWGNPYVYDNNQGDGPNVVAPDAQRLGAFFSGAPNHNPDFDLYSMGQKGMTAIMPNGASGSGNGNGIDDDGTNGVDDANEALFNGRERTAPPPTGDLGDDINNFKTDK
jgi:prepilin-type N-terminal cleavage/methylation domain-containing protein